MDRRNIHKLVVLYKYFNLCLHDIVARLQASWRSYIVRKSVVRATRLPAGQL
jgi:hypothetical protein